MLGQRLVFILIMGIFFVFAGNAHCASVEKELQEFAKEALVVQAEVLWQYRNIDDLREYFINFGEWKELNWQIANARKTQEAMTSRNQIDQIETMEYHFDYSSFIISKEGDRAEMKVELLIEETHSELTLEGDLWISSAQYPHYLLFMKNKEGIWKIYGDQIPEHLKRTDFPKEKTKGSMEMPREENTTLFPFPEEQASVCTELLAGKSSYNRQAAVIYADTYAYSPDSDYCFFSSGDCANFVSQCGHAGGFNMIPPGGNCEWWTRKSPHCADDDHSLSWTTAAGLAYRILDCVGKTVSEASSLEKGDVIIYNNSLPGSYNHAAIVVAHDADGEPLIDAHTFPRKHDLWSKVYHTQAWFLHITK